MEPKFKIGDEVIYKERLSAYYDKHLIIAGIHHYYDFDNNERYSYRCTAVSPNDISPKFSIDESDLELTKGKNIFTISLKKHKCINLKFAL